MRKARWELFDQMRKPRLKEQLRLIVLLQEFYKNRQVDFDVHLHIEDHGASCRLENQGANVQDARSKEEKKKKLVIYQQEMTEFTKFLEKKLNWQAQEESNPR